MATHFYKSPVGRFLYDRCLSEEEVRKLSDPDCDGMLVLKGKEIRSKIKPSAKKKGGV
jgi:hypothetical protein